MAKIRFVILFSGCFPIFLPLFEMLGVSFFAKDGTAFIKTVLEKIRGERNRCSHQVWNIENKQTNKIHGYKHMVLLSNVIIVHKNCVCKPIPQYKAVF